WLLPRQRPSKRASGAAPAGQTADAAAYPGAGGDAGDRRLPAAGLAAGGGADPRRLFRVGGADARRAGVGRGVRALAVRCGPVTGDGAVRTALWARRAGPAARSRAVRSLTRGRAGVARAAYEGWRTAG